MHEERSAALSVIRKSSEIVALAVPDHFLRIMRQFHLYPLILKGVFLRLRAHCNPLALIFLVVFFLLIFTSLLDH